MAGLQSNIPPEGHELRRDGPAGALQPRIRCGERRHQTPDGSAERRERAGSLQSTQMRARILGSDRPVAGQGPLEPGGGVPESSIVQICYGRRLAIRGAILLNDGLGDQPAAPPANMRGADVVQRVRHAV